LVLTAPAVETAVWFGDSNGSECGEYCEIGCSDSRECGDYYEIYWFSQPQLLRLLFGLEILTAMNVEITVKFRGFNGSECGDYFEIRRFNGSECGDYCEIRGSNGSECGDYCHYSTELTPPPISVDSPISPKDEIWFLRVCHHISNVVYVDWTVRRMARLCVTAGFRREVNEICPLLGHLAAYSGNS
jgi:hypothetical protein